MLADNMDICAKYRGSSVAYLQQQHQQKQK